MFQNSGCSLAVRRARLCNPILGLKTPGHSLVGTAQHSSFTKAQLGPAGWGRGGATPWLISIQGQFRDQLQSLGPLRLDFCWRRDEVALATRAKGTSFRKDFIKSLQLGRLDFP